MIDSVDREFLWHTLGHLGIKGKFLNIRVAKWFNH